MSWKTGTRLLLGFAVAVAVGCRSTNNSSASGHASTNSSARWPWSKRTPDEDKNKKLTATGANDLDSLSPAPPKVPTKTGANKPYWEVEPAGGYQPNRSYVPLGEPRILTTPGVGGGPTGY